MVKRLKILPPGAPMSEPGLSYLLKVYSGSKTHTLLFDTGISGSCLLHNAKTFASSKAVLMGEVNAKFEDIEAVILSHGHFDHCGGLLGFLMKLKKTSPYFCMLGHLFPAVLKSYPSSKLTFLLWTKKLLDCCVIRRC